MSRSIYINLLYGSESTVEALVKDLKGIGVEALLEKHQACMQYTTTLTGPPKTKPVKQAKKAAKKR